MNGTILIVDDEREIADLIEFYLTNEGFTVRKFYLGEDALRSAEAEEPDLAILDVMLPDIDGYEICRRIRRNHTYPIMMLTAKEEEIDKITGLALGADDYVTKPFRPLELVARVKAQLRRSTRYNAGMTDERGRALSVRGLTMNSETHVCTLDEKPLSLTPIEFSILWLLCETPGRVLSAEELFERAWGEKYLTNSNNTVMVHIRHLREKLGDSPEKPRYIRTVWEWGIKSMRSRAKGFMIWLGCTALCVVAALAAMWVIDNVFSGYVRDWFESTSRLGWQPFKRIGVIAALALCVATSTACFFCARFAARRREKQIARRLTAFVRALGDGREDEEPLDGELAALDASLKRLRDEAVRSRNLAEREMQRKSDLITYLAHDLKTPLASVVAYLSLLDENPELAPDSRAKYVGVALDKAYRLEELIGELFEVIRFNLQSISIGDERVNLPFMLEQLADEFYPILLSQDKRVSVRCEDGVSLRGDADKLARVFNNLLKNAAAYSYPGTEIAIEAARRDGGVIISFRNRGDPIPEAKQAQIFEKFYRLDGARSTKTGGAGLGLAIAKEIVEAHGGRVCVKSDEEATVFSVFLPSRPTPADAPIGRIA